MPISDIQHTAGAGADPGGGHGGQLTPPFGPSIITSLQLLH